MTMLDRIPWPGVSGAFEIVVLACMYYYLILFLKGTRGAAVLTEAALKQAQGLLDEGLETSEVAEELAVKRDTLAKAIGAGRLHKPTKKKTAARVKAPRS